MAGGGKAAEFETDGTRIFIESKTSKIVVENRLNHQILKTAVHVATIPQSSFSSAWTLRGPSFSN